MLAGSDNYVKADRMIHGFVRDALGKKFTNVEAATVVHDGCEILKLTYLALTPRLLDHEIWKYQRAL
jgi:hypothetical protein